MGFALEQRVSVRREVVAGELVASSAREIVLRRGDERAGTVYVHLPRLGYEVTAA
ncbi:MAG TPA: hypothetical protein VJR89_29185 [Polyangiales bacterium]|nr:hypothetical protein [Polyangiales bacterium]